MRVLVLSFADRTLPGGADPLDAGCAGGGGAKFFERRSPPGLKDMNPFEERLVELIDGKSVIGSGGLRYCCSYRRSLGTYLVAIRGDWWLARLVDPMCERLRDPSGILTESAEERAVDGPELYMAAPG